MTSDTVGWIATAVMVVASIGIAHMNVLGLWLMFLGNILWAVVGHMSGLDSLIAVSAIMGILDLYGVLLWKRKQKHLTRYDDLMAPPMNGQHKRNFPFRPRIWNPED